MPPIADGGGKLPEGEIAARGGAPSMAGEDNLGGTF